MEQYAEGKWWKNKNCIGLKADRKFRSSSKLLPKQLDLNEKDLELTWNNGQQKAVYKMER